MSNLQEKQQAIRHTQPSFVKPKIRMAVNLFCWRQAMSPLTRRGND